MKLHLMLTISSFAKVAAQGSCSAQGAFSLKLESKCSLEALEVAYADYLAAPENQILSSSSCNLDLQILLNGQDVDDLCRNAIDLNGEITLDEIVQQKDSKFVESFYRGNTYWNEEVQTNYDLDDPNGPTINKLKDDISQVPGYYELAEKKKVKYPNEHDNFNLDNCELNAVMCCWSLDRQANDNNGNCKTPYDTNCIDKDPADNADLCGVHLDRGNTSNNLNTDGFTTFRGDNNDGEGPVHCHGFAFSNNENDAETRYMGNNLFYISMYDHLYKRGYARNIPGAPMCGCVEQMPVVTRSDCTQVDVTETFTFDYNPSSGFSVTASNVDIEFNSCQGLNRRNNDLSAYVARLETEGKVTLAQKNGLKKHLVEKNNCPNAIKNNLASKGITRGLPEGAYEQTYSFPSTDTDQFVHGICVLGASSVSAVSDTYLDLEYTLIPNFRDGVTLWGNRDYTVQNITGAEMCEGGLYLQPSKHKSIPRYTDIEVGMNSIDGGNYMSMCVFVSSDSRNGKWNQILPNDRFTVSDEFSWSNEQFTGKMKSYCKTMPEPPTPSPSASPTRDSLGKYYDFPAVDTNEFVHGICVMGASSALATSTDPNLTYTLVPDFQNGVKMWADRNYITSEVSGAEMCQGGIYLEPSRHKTIVRGTDISVEASPSNNGVPLTVCAFVVSTDRRTGKWDQTLPTEGFTVSSSSFKWSSNGRMKSYCKTL